MISSTLQNRTKCFSLVAALLLVFFAVFPTVAQTVDEPAKQIVAASKDTPDFRVEKIPVAGGAEIITIFARKDNFDADVSDGQTEIPLLSVMRDTLGDDRPENDRLRYVWMHSYTRASFWQKAAAFVPFLYIRTTNNKDIGTRPPPHVVDMNSNHNGIWGQVLWVVFKKMILGEMGVGPKASVLQYRQNSQDYKRTSVAKALTVLSLFESVSGEKLLSDAESKDIQARLWLTDKTLGAMMPDEELNRVYDTEIVKKRDMRGRNWELLRQYSEAQGLYFEPLEMPDGSARHATVWIAAEDMAENKGRKFDGRFLNIKDPWNDVKLANWKGYTQVKWFDEDERIVEPHTLNAKPKTLIPLALYGLDNPKIPTILIDFRDTRNAKRREMSKRILTDLTNSVISFSPFGSIPLFVSKFAYDFVTGRRGIDINQESRIRSYAQLKMLLSLDATLTADFRGEIADRLERVSLNPLENDLSVEADLARKQYANLIAYAKRDDGLPALIARDRREEMVKLAHSRKRRALITAARFLTFGLYTHRENVTPELLAKLDIRRQLNYHERVLNEIAYRSAKPEVDSDMSALRRSLEFVAEHGDDAGDKTARSLLKIFAITDDEEVRLKCLAGLYRIDDSGAKKYLLAIYKDPAVVESLRKLSAGYLKRALDEGKRISARDAAVIGSFANN